jgi:hypothetical protein
MDENGKMTPVRTVPGMGRKGIKDSDGGDEFNYDTKNFGKCHNVPPAQQ